MSRERALEIAARSTVRDAAEAVGVHPNTVLRWCNKAGVTPAHTLKYRPGVAAYVDGCRCEPCADAVKDLPHAAHLYVTGEADTRAIGEMLGVSKSRAGQWLDMWIGGFEYRDGRRLHKAGAAFAARRAERDRQEAEAARRAEEELKARARAEGVTCTVCGTPHHRWIRGDWSVACSPECSEMWQLVRLFHDDHHDDHRLNIAQWQIAHPDKHTPAQLAHARRVISGEGPTHERGSWASRDRTRWLIEGSQSWDIACRAYREGWPTFATWPEDIQQQIREHFETAEVPA